MKIGNIWGIDASYRLPKDDGSGTLTRTRKKPNAGHRPLPPMPSPFTAAAQKNRTTKQLPLEEKNAREAEEKNACCRLLGILIWFGFGSDPKPNPNVPPLTVVPVLPYRVRVPLVTQGEKERQRRRGKKERPRIGDRRRRRKMGDGPGPGMKDLVMAGSETSSNTIEWAMTELLRHPDKMAAARSELKQVIGACNFVKESDIMHLPYLAAVMKETLRLHPPAPLIPRRADATTTIRGFTIPKHTQMLINVWALGNDDTLWDKPTHFLPERFIESDVNFNGKHFQFTPFGAGKRICPGIPLASRIVLLVLASLINSFSWTPSPEEVDVKAKFRLVLQKATPLKAFASPLIEMTQRNLGAYNDTELDIFFKSHYGTIKNPNIKTLQLILTDAEMVKEILSNKFGHFSKPPQSAQGKMLARGLARLEGTQWAVQRRRLNPVFRLKKFKGLKHLICHLHLLLLI
ncbi:Cytochrome P450 82A1 [Nymphaea thermarum]|nr:Cytochrome P450 82A1 [Nymphaea thermarum]